MLPLESKNVLICLRYGIGDVVMELPVLSALRAALPDARITALAASPAHELLEQDARIDALVTTDRWRLRHRWDRGDAATRKAIVAWLREEAFDMVLDARHATDAVSQAIWAAGIRSIEARRTAERKALEDGGGGSDAIRAAVRVGWGLEVPDRPGPRLRPGLRHHAMAAAFLREHGADGRRPFAVSPVASSALKRWPVERLAAVADHAIDRWGGPALILEGPDAPAGAAVVGAMRRGEAAVRVGAHHLLTTAALLRRCAGLVCNDTGLMHIAAAVGTPTVGVFGPTRAASFLPRGRRVAGVEPAGIMCTFRDVRSLSPPACLVDGRCLIADRGCIAGVATEDVVAAVDRVAGPRAERRGNMACVPLAPARPGATSSTVAS